MADVKRRGYGEDGIYFDHRARLQGQRPPQDLCWALAGRGLARLRRGREADPQEGQRQDRTEVKDKLKELHSELDAGVRTAQGYTVEKAVADWLAEGLPGRTAKTVEANRDSLRPLLAVIGKDPAEGPDGAGRADRAEEDGGHARDPDAAEGA